MDMRSSGYRSDMQQVHRFLYCELSLREHLPRVFGLRALMCGSNMRCRATRRGLSQMGYSARVKMEAGIMRTSLDLRQDTALAPRPTSTVPRCRAMARPMTATVMVQAPCQVTFLTLISPQPAVTSDFADCMLHKTWSLR